MVWPCNVLKHNEMGTNEGWTKVKAVYEKLGQVCRHIKPQATMMRPMRRGDTMPMISEPKFNEHNKGQTGPKCDILPPDYRKFLREAQQTWNDLGSGLRSALHKHEKFPLTTDTGDCVLDLMINRLAQDQKCSANAFNWLRRELRKLRTDMVGTDKVGFLWIVFNGLGDLRLTGIPDYPDVVYDISQDLCLRIIYEHQQEYWDANGLLVITVGMVRAAKAATENIEQSLSSFWKMIVRPFRLEDDTGYTAHEAVSDAAMTLELFYYVWAVRLHNREAFDAVCTHSTDAESWMERLEEHCYEETGIPRVKATSLDKCDATLLRSTIWQQQCINGNYCRHNELGCIPAVQFSPRVTVDDYLRRPAAR